jgi:hypothetical protein
LQVSLQFEKNPNDSRRIDLFHISVGLHRISAVSLQSLKGDMTIYIDGFEHYNLRVYGAPGSHLPKRNETGSSYGWFKEPHYFPCSFIPTWEVS